MKNSAFNKFINAWPRNPTQERYRRAIKMPSGELSSEFSKRYDEFRKTTRLENKYSKEYGND